MKTILLSAALVVALTSCKTGGGTTEDPPEDTPEDAARGLAESFIQACRDADGEAVADLCSWPFWIDRSTLQRKTNNEDWNEMIQELSGEELSVAEVYAFPPMEEWGKRGKDTYGHFLERAEEDIRVVEITVAGKDRGIGLVCGRAKEGWRILGLDDNNIRPNLKD